MPDTRTLFQNVLQPDPASGVLPQSEGIVSFTQTINAPGGTTVAGKPLKPAQGFFLVFIGVDNQVLGAGAVAFTRLYPIDSPLAATWSTLQVDGAIDVSTIVGLFPVGPVQMIVPYVKAGAGASSRVATIFAFQLRDCPDNWKVIP